jgi:ribosomal protein S18 acetylase RimI-like enzyme
VAEGSPYASPRPETDADREFLIRLYATTRLDELALIAWSDEEKARFIAQQFTAQHGAYRARYPDADFLVIERDGEPIGRLYVARSAARIHVVDIVLLPEHCGQGIGGGLLRALLGEARQSGRPVTLYVERSNPAKRLYDRLGFRAVSSDDISELLEWVPPEGQLNTAS